MSAATQISPIMLRQVIFPVIWLRIKSYADQVENLRKSCSPHCRSSFAHFLYFSTFFMFGMSVGMAGPTLTDYLISFFTNIDIIDALSWLLFTQSTLRFVGAIVAGTLVDRYDWFLISFLTKDSAGLNKIPYLLIGSSYVTRTNRPVYTWT